MALDKDTWLDPSKKAGSILDTVLESTSEEAVAAQKHQSSVETELQRAPIAIMESDRSQSRVLFITSDISVLQEGSLLRMHFINLSEVFSEVHIMVLSESWQAKKGFERLGKNIWVYTTSVRYWWQQMFAAKALAGSQLKFADGFRPDIVVALDPFEAGLSGLWIAEKYDRAFQVHITEDFYIPEFKEKAKANKWRLRIAQYVLKRTLSVRTATEVIKKKIQEKFSHIEDMSLLPRHYDIHSVLRATQEKEIKDAFPQYAFVILYVGKLDHESQLFRAIDASRSILTAKSIAMFILGDGPNKVEFQQRTQILGIQEQVVFLSDTSNLISYLKSADVLLCPDTNEASDEIVMKAAAAGLPVIASHTQLRDDLFVDGESAFLCNKDSTLEFQKKLTQFLNTNSLRTQFSNNARDTIKNRLHEDPNVYKLAYRDSIEGVFAVEQEEMDGEAENDENEAPLETMVIDGQEMKLPEQSEEKTG